MFSLFIKYIRQLWDVRYSGIPGKKRKHMKCSACPSVVLWVKQKIAVVCGEYFNSDVTVCLGAHRSPLGKWGSLPWRDFIWDEEWKTVGLGWTGRQGNWVEGSNSKGREFWNTIMCAEMNDMRMIMRSTVRTANKYGEESERQIAKLDKEEFVLSLIT